MNTRLLVSLGFSLRVLLSVQWATGLVLSTGHDTKVMMSIAKAPEKSSHLNARINTVSLGCFSRYSPVVGEVG